MLAKRLQTRGFVQDEFLLFVYVFMCMYFQQRINVFGFSTSFIEVIVLETHDKI